MSQSLKVLDCMCPTGTAAKGSQKAALPGFNGLGQYAGLKP